MRLVDARFESGELGRVAIRAAREDCLTERDLGVRAFCGARSPIVGWLCTRPPGHVGDHVAHISYATIAARWERAEKG